MEERALFCNNCRHIFNLPAGEANSLIHCPECGNFDVADAPCWAPLNSGSSIFDDSGWKYECQKCREIFILPIPKSPTEEKERKCAVCGSGHLYLLTDLGAQPLYCD